jgi:hypothetical protein
MRRPCTRGGKQAWATKIVHAPVSASFRTAAAELSKMCSTTGMTRDACVQPVSLSTRLRCSEWFAALAECRAGSAAPSGLMSYPAGQIPAARLEGIQASRLRPQQELPRQPVSSQSTVVRTAAPRQPALCRLAMSHAVHARTSSAGNRPGLQWRAGTTFLVVPAGSGEAPENLEERVNLFGPSAPSPSIVPVLGAVEAPPWQLISRWPGLVAKQDLCMLLTEDRSFMRAFAVSAEIRNRSMSCVNGASP